MQAATRVDECWQNRKQNASKKIMSGLEETVRCMTGASANVGQIIVIVLLVVLVGLHISTTILCVRAAKSAAESAENTKNVGRQRNECEKTAIKMQTGFMDLGSCATACGEACVGSSDIPISAKCARKCAAVCGFDLV